MKNHSTIKSLKTSGMLVILFLFVFLFGCRKSNETESDDVSYNPSQSISITDFIPKKGGGGQQLVIYGDNFGNDTSIVDVFIGGKKALVIGLNNVAIYCIVPEKAYEGDIEVRIGENDLEGVAKSENPFEYQKKMVVSTLAGEKDERGNYDTKDGPFDDCGGFQNPSWLIFDPKDSTKLYMGQDGGDVRLIDFSDSMVTTPITRGMGNWGRIRTIDFTIDGDHMIIANDQGDVNGIATSILSRANNFKDPQMLTAFKQCNGASVHPITGELYFNSYEKGQFYRFDLVKYFDEGLGIKDYKELFKIQDNQWEFQIDIAPNGNYAYIVVINQHYILRTDYNWKKKEFMQPYLVCGQPRESGWEDGVGASARLNTPYQGVFVKNPDYAGTDNEYDFYFTEQHNHDIRILTPEGKVTTFAGRGSPSLNSDSWGLVDGSLRDKARFNQPKGLAYDAQNKIFYIGDSENRSIRKISFEGE